MPIYEYRCEDCKALFEKIVFKDSEEIRCPQCGSVKVDKQLSSFAVSNQQAPSPKMGAACPRGGT